MTKAFQRGDHHVFVSKIVHRIMGNFAFGIGGQGNTAAQQSRNNE
jgi:hypothetical protein